MTTREKIYTIAIEHHWRETVYSSEQVLQIERGSELLSIGLLPNDGGLGRVLHSSSVGWSRPVTGLPSILAIVRKRPE